MSGPRKRVAVLISGRGSNMASLIEAAADPAYPAEIALVLANRHDAAGLDRARAAGIAADAIDHKAFPDRPSFDAALDARLRAERIDLVCLAGFMRLLTPAFVEGWRDRMINIHPSLLPLFPGLHTHRRAIEAGMKLAGCTVHFVRAEMDSGPIIGQAVVPIAPGDSEDSLAARVLSAEHRLYPLALALVADGLARVEGERLVLDAQLPIDASGMLVSPAFG